MWPRCTNSLIPEVNELKEIKSAARAAMALEVQAAKEKYVKEVAPVIAERLKNLSLDTDQSTIGLMLERATMQRTLMGDFPLLTADGRWGTVGTVMDDPEKWHGTRFADPLEPEVDKRVAWINLRSGGKPYLYSHLHHGTYYRLDRAPALIEVTAVASTKYSDYLSL